MATSKLRARQDGEQTRARGSVVPVRGPRGGLILGSFAGGGPTAIAAIRLGVRYSLIELDPKWSRYCRRRIRAKYRRLLKRGLQPPSRRFFDK